MVRDGHPKEGPEELVFDMIPIQSKHPAYDLLDNTERRVVSDESMARDYLETFYSALVDNGLRWPMLDFNDLLTSFRSAGELILLPTIESTCEEDMERDLRRFLWRKRNRLRDNCRGKTIVLMRIQLYNN